MSSAGNRRVTIDEPTVMPFSSAYDLMEIRVQPAESEYARINDALYDKLLRRPDAQPTEPSPIFARVPDNSIHFELFPDPSVGLHILELPFRRVESLNIPHPPSDERLLVAKPRHSVRLIRMLDTDRDITLEQ